MNLALEKLQKSLGTALDAVLITDELNIRYLCGFPFTDGYLVVTPDNAWVYADSRYIEAARAQIGSEFHVELLDHRAQSELGEHLQKQGIRTLGYEDRSMTCHDLASWKTQLPNILFAPVDSLILNLREYKTGAEQDTIIAAQRIAEKAFDRILGFITPDRTEQEVALELEFTMRSLGAQSTSFDTIAVSGKASSLPHGVPRPVKLEKGFLTMDFGALYQGYCSDMTRTVCLGQPDAEMKRVYQTVYDAQQAALDIMAEGLLCREADLAARKVIEDAGYGDCFGHGLGHGVGLFIHEMPRLSPAAPAEKRLERGHVVTVEPGIYLEGKYGVRIEDMVIFTENGPVDITLAPKNLIIL